MKEQTELNRDLKNILIKAYIYPVFKSEIEKNRESHIYRYFNFEGGWADNNIVENIKEYYTNWTTKPEELQLANKIINYYLSYGSSFVEKEQYLFFILYGLKKESNIFYEKLKKYGLGNNISLGEVLEIINRYELPDNIEYSNFDLKNMISSENIKEILSVMADFLNKKYEKMSKYNHSQIHSENEYSAKREMTSEEEKTEKTDGRSEQVTKTKQSDDGVFKLPNSLFSHDGITCLKKIWNNVNGDNSFETILPDKLFEFSDGEKKLFSSKLRDIILGRLKQSSKVILRVDYFPEGILNEALKSANIMIEQGILPFKTTMIITQNMVLLDNKQIELNDESCIDFAVEWWTQQLGYFNQQEYVPIASEAVGRKNHH